jgi:hypothetical protein
MNSRAFSATIGFTIRPGAAAAALPPPAAFGARPKPFGAGAFGAAAGCEMGWPSGPYFLTKFAYSVS